jgi:hypothetical protein
MVSRLTRPLTCLLLLAAPAVQSCGPATTPTPTPAPERPAAPAPAPAEPPPAATFEPSAPNEMVSEAALTARRLVVGDMMRLGVVDAVQQGPRGVLRTAVGRAFHTSNSRELLYPKLALSYSAWASETAPLVVELWERGQKIGEFRENVFFIGPEYATPIDCAGPGPAGVCGYGPEGPPALPAPSPGVAVQPPGPAASPDPGAAQPESGRDHRGLHLGIGLGGGSADLTCDGCDFSSQTALSGFVSLGGAVSDNTILGAEGTGWTTKTDPGFNAQVYSLMATVTRYLEPESGAFLKIGLGLIGYREDSDIGELRAKGFGYAGRLGYELRIAGPLLVVPYVGLLGTLGGTDFEFNGSSVGKFGITNLQFGLGLGVN